ANIQQFDLWEHEEEEEQDDLWEHEGEEEQDAPLTQRTDTSNPLMANLENQDFNGHSAGQGAADPEESTAMKEITETKAIDSPLEKGEHIDQTPTTLHSAPIKQDSGFMGLRGRSKIASDSMPVGPFDEVISLQEKPTKIFQKTPQTPPKNPVNNTEKNSARTEKSDETKVFSSEGELWTVESEMETTLIRPSATSQLNPDYNSFEQEVTQAASQENAEFFTEPPPISNSISSEWQVEEIVDKDHLQSLSDAEELIVSISRQREVSPSDPEIQARLEVGRPRLSQIFNSLRRSGILSVRKRGRSRLFRLSDNASDLI
ncbi:MAG: hypothetical protein CMA87_02855, partial [Euryarchaeota archaeon]|nr:hypothetical protein [Euryarchaeota archaeon]